MKDAVAFGLLLRLAAPFIRKVLDGVVWTVGYQITSTLWERASLPWRLDVKIALLKPKVTMATMIAGLSALAGMCVTTVGGLAPLADARGLELLRPWIFGIDTALGIIACVCTVLSAIGRSIAPSIDHLSPTARAAAEPPSPAASSPTALQGGTMATSTAPVLWEELLGKGLDEFVALADQNEAVILQFINSKGITLENVAETFVDDEIEKAPVSGVLNLVPRDLVVQGVNKAISALVAAGQAKEQIVFNLVMGKVAAYAKTLGG